MGRIITFFLFSIFLLDAKEWKLHIEGMHCISCTLAVKKALLSVHGVQEAKVNFKNESATVSTDETISLKTMQDAVSKTGYRATTPNN